MAHFYTVSLLASCFSTLLIFSPFSHYGEVDCVLQQSLNLWRYLPMKTEVCKALLPHLSFRGQVRGQVCVPKEKSLLYLCNPDCTSMVMIAAHAFCCSCIENLVQFVPHPCAMLSLDVCSKVLLCGTASGTLEKSPHYGAEIMRAGTLLIGLEFKIQPSDWSRGQVPHSGNKGK